MVVSLGLAVGAAAAAAAEPDGLAATRNVTSAWEQVAVSGPPGMPGRRAEIAVADAVAPDWSFGSTAVIGLASMRDLRVLRAGYGLRRVRAIPALDAVEVGVDAVQLDALLARARTDPRIRYVAPLGPRRAATSMPNDPLLHAGDAPANLPAEWQFAAAHVDRALDLSQGRPEIVVGVIDTGVADIPDLAGKIDSVWEVRGTQVVPSPSRSNDDRGHGTAVASLIAANVDDGFGMAGFGGATHVIAVHAGNQGYFLDTYVALALTKLVALGARIVNLSLGGYVPSAPILVDAIHLAAANGVLLVAAAGNDRRAVAWPAADLQPAGGARSFGLAVGASTAAGGLADFSNSGRHLSLLAPGVYDGDCSGVLVALPSSLELGGACFANWFGDGGARYGEVKGTSFAAPEVAGIAALIWAARPELTNYQVADIIKQSARRDASDWTPTIGCGVLDAGAALELALHIEAGASTDTAAVCSTTGEAPPSWPTELNQTITFPRLPNRPLGDPDFHVRATASSRLPVSFSAAGTCTTSGATVHPTEPGTCAITASQPGDEHYNLAASITRSFTITRPPRPTTATSSPSSTPPTRPVRASR